MFFNSLDKVMELNAEESAVPFKGVGADRSDTWMDNCKGDGGGGSPSRVDEDWSSLSWSWW